MRRGAVAALFLLSAAAGADDQGQWVSLFNGHDLEGWVPKFTGSPVGENYLDTFQVRDGKIVVDYSRYDGFHGEFGHLFYKTPFKAYRIRMEYRFFGEQAAGGPTWGYRNAGVMLESQSPESMSLDQNFPVSLEFQFLGQVGNEPRPTGNVCTPGTNVVIAGKLETEHCLELSGHTVPGDGWVTAEAEVLADGTVTYFIDGEKILSYTDPQYDPTDADTKHLNPGPDLMLRGGYIAIQSESHPVEYRNIEIMQLPDGE
ncbi:MAG: DUF1080 domain-containing protein [Alphaproteobacteria bacterium]|nr:MAG: DUF1080 domain-containing protein [Alphaproteobacteria bacterium]